MTTSFLFGGSSPITTVLDSGMYASNSPSPPSQSAPQSNVAAAAEIAALGGAPLANLILAHLSDENNAPELALAAAGEALEGAGRRDVAVHVSTQHSPLGPIEVRQGAHGPEPIEREGVAASCTG